MNDAIAKVLAEPEVRERLAGMSVEVVASSPEQLTELINVQVDRFSREEIWQKE